MSARSRRLRPFGACDRLVGEHERQPGAIRQLEDRLGQLARRNIRPLDVLEHDDHGLFCRKRLEPAQVGPRDPAVLARICKVFGPKSEQLAERREHLVELLPEKCTEPGAGLCPNGDLGLPRLGREPAEEDLHERPWREASVREAVPLEPRRAFARQRSELGDEARLADPGRAGQDDDSSPTREEIVDHGSQLRDLPVSTNAGQSGRRGLSRRGSYEPGDRNGRISALDGDVAERLEHETMCEPSGRGFSDEDRPWLGRRLHARSDVRRVTESHSLRVGRADESDRGASAVDPDPHAEACDLPRLLDVSRVLAHELENAEAGERCPLRVVLVRDRHAEIGADAVALVRLHGPAVFLDGAAHDRHALAHERLGLLRRQSLSERRRADDVCEEDRHRPNLVCDHVWLRGRGQLRRLGGSFGRAGRGRRDRRVLPKDRPLEFLQPGARVDAELLEQRRSPVAIGLEGFGLPPRSVEGEHQLAAQPLAKGMLGHEGLELADELAVAAEREVGVDSAFERRDTQFLELEDGRLCELLVGEVCERRAAPERQSLA